jgi:cytochrome P450
LQRFPTGMSSADHLTFASGVHACLGQHLARLLIQVMLDRLANRVNRVELLAPVKRTRNYLVRSLERVQVRMTAL